MLQLFTLLFICFRNSTLQQNRSQSEESLATVSSLVTVPVHVMESVPDNSDDEEATVEPQLTQSHLRTLEDIFGQGYYQH